MVGLRLGSTSFRLTLTRATGITGSGASCMSTPILSGLASPPAALVRNYPGPSAVGASPSLQIQQRDEVGPALGPSSVPRTKLVSSPSPAAAPRSPRCEGTLRAAPMLWLVPAVA